MTGEECSSSVIYFDIKYIIAQTIAIVVVDKPYVTFLIFFLCCIIGES